MIMLLGQPRVQAAVDQAEKQAADLRQEREVLEVQVVVGAGLVDHETERVQRQPDER